MNDEKIIDTLLKTDFKDLPQRPVWVDGSGLSRYNLFTPKDFVGILKKMKNEFGIERMKIFYQPEVRARSPIITKLKKDTSLLKPAPSPGLSL